MQQDTVDETAQILPGNRRIKRWVFGGILLFILFALAFVWLKRVAIAENYIQDYLDESGVQAAYELDDIGVRTQKISNLVIGDPADPDLTVKSLELDVLLGFSGASLQWVRAKGVQLRGVLKEDGSFTLGEVDKFRDLDSKDPFAFPDIALDLDDTNVMMKTPWGDVLASASGRGHLYGSFSGSMLINAAKLSYNDCMLEHLSYSTNIGISSAKPHFSGPMTVNAINCPKDNLAVRQVTLDSDFRLNDMFDRWIGNAKFNAASIVSGEHRLFDPEGDIEFDGGMDRTSFKLAVNDGAYKNASMQVGKYGLTGEGRIGFLDGLSFAMRGNADFASAKLSPEIISSIDGVAQNTKDTPFGPLMTKLSPAIGRAIANFDGGLRYDVMLPQNSKMQLDVEALDIRTASGAQLTQTSKLRFEQRKSGIQLVSPLSFRMAGGDLPKGTLALRRNGSGWAGRLQLSPYASGNARFALSDFDFSGRPGGNWKFGGQALLSGPISGGYIDGLSLPLNGGFGNSGLSLLTGCNNIRFNGINLSGVQGGAHNFRLCSDSGPLVKTGVGATQIKARIPNFAFTGNIGGSPIELSSTSLLFSLKDGFDAENISVAIGSDNAITAFEADSIIGAFDKEGLSGQLTNGSGQIANVPLLLSDANGHWTYRDGNIFLESIVAVADAGEVKKFEPLSVPEMLLEYSDGIITAIGEVYEPTTQTKVAGVDIRHELSSAVGRALFAVDDLNFNEGFQPELLTPLTLGVIANVSGDIYGDGQILWDNSSDGIRSKGRFGTPSMDLAAAFGPITGLSSELEFTDLLKLETAKGQVARIASVNPGIEALGGVINYQLLADQKVKIEGGQWPFAGGQLTLEETIWDFSDDKPRSLLFRVKGIEVARFLQQFEFDDLLATGVFDGELPMTFDFEGGHINNGRLIARAGGGNISYIGDITYEDMGAISNFAFQALRSLDYKKLEVTLNGKLEGLITTDISFEGIQQGDGADRNFITKQIAKLPLKFDVKISGEFFTLTRTIRELYDRKLLVQRALQQKGYSTENVENEENDGL